MNMYANMLAHECGSFALCALRHTPFEHFTCVYVLLVDLQKYQLSLFLPTNLDLV